MENQIEDLKNEYILKIATAQVEYDLLLIGAGSPYSLDVRKDKMIELKKLIVFYEKELYKI